MVDATGVGRAVTDMLHAAALNPVRITITSGFRAVGTRGVYKVPKQDLISSLIVALQTDRLKIASAIKHADELRRELENFRMFSSEAGHASYEAAAGHDDFVIGSRPRRLVRGTWGDCLREAATARQWVEVEERSAIRAVQPSGPLISARVALSAAT